MAAGSAFTPTTSQSRSRSRLDDSYDSHQMSAFAASTSTHADVKHTPLPVPVQPLAVQNASTPSVTASVSALPLDLNDEYAALNRSLSPPRRSAAAAASASAAAGGTESDGDAAAEADEDYNEMLDFEERKRAKRELEKEQTINRTATRTLSQLIDSMIKPQTHTPIQSTRHHPSLPPQRQPLPFIVSSNFNNSQPPLPPSAGSTAAVTAASSVSQLSAPSPSTAAALTSAADELLSLASSSLWNAASPTAAATSSAASIRTATRSVSASALPLPSPLAPSTPIAVNSSPSPAVAAGDTTSPVPGKVFATFQAASDARWQSARDMLSKLQTLSAASDEHRTRYAGAIKQLNAALSMNDAVNQSAEQLTRIDRHLLLEAKFYANKLQAVHHFVNHHSQQQATAAAAAAAAVSPSSAGAGSANSSASAELTPIIRGLLQPHASILD